MNKYLPINNILYNQNQNDILSKIIIWNEYFIKTLGWISKNKQFFCYAKVNRYIVVEIRFIINSLHIYFQKLLYKYMRQAHNKLIFVIF